MTFPHRKGRFRSRAPAPDLTSDRDPLGFGDRAMGRAITSRGGDARMADARQCDGKWHNVPNFAFIHPSEAVRKREADSSANLPR